MNLRDGSCITDWHDWHLRQQSMLWMRNTMTLQRFNINDTNL